MRRLKANSRTHEGAEYVVKRSIPALVDSGAGKPKVGVLVLRALRLLPPDDLVLAVAPTLLHPFYHVVELLDHSFLLRCFVCLGIL